MLFIKKKLMYKFLQHASGNDVDIRFTVQGERRAQKHLLKSSEVLIKGENNNFSLHFLYIHYDSVIHFHSNLLFRSPTATDRMRSGYEFMPVLQICSCG